jgi:acyl-CoA thioester hydrolase
MLPAGVVGAILGAMNDVTATDGATITVVRIRPRHCDAQDMVHASRYHEFFEDAFLDWLDARAGGYRAVREREGVDLVMAATACEYSAPARLDDELTVETVAEHAGRTSLSVRFTVRRDDAAGELVAVGRTRYVCVRDGAPVPLPAALAASAPAPPLDRRSARALLDRLHHEQGRFYAGDDSAEAELRLLLAPDIAWHVPGDNDIAGHYRGPVEVFGYFTRRRALARGTMRMHPRGLLVGEDGHVASLTDGTAVVDGVEHAWSTVGLYRVENGRIAECWLLPLDQAAFDRVWTSSG